MLGRLFRHHPLTPFSSKSLVLKTPAIPKSATNPLRPGPFRSFFTSSRFNQQYRYRRFNEPLPGANAPQGSYFQFWYRLTNGQKIMLVGFGGGASLFYVSHLETVEPTGRRRFIFMSRAMED